MQFDWRAASGPALTTATALIAFLVDRHFVVVPNPAPLFVCVVALASSISGITSGMISAVIAVASSALPNRAGRLIRGDFQTSPRSRREGALPSQD
jgi:hypothetical protein